MGGTIALRYSRFSSRKRAIDEINKLFDENIEVSFYDGLPTTIENVDEFLSSEEEDENVLQHESIDVSE